MGEANTDAPAPRKRGRPRTVTDDQQVPEVGHQQLHRQYKYKADSMDSETSNTAARRSTSLSQAQGGHNYQSAISRTGTRIGH
jgi:hypothetical protein